MSVTAYQQRPATEVHCGETNEFMGRTDTYPGTAERTGGQTGGRSTDRPRSTQKKHSQIKTDPDTHTHKKLHNTLGQEHHTTTHT